MKIFICFSNNRGIGGLLAGKIYNTLVSYLSSEDVYFSSAENRPYGNNYRDEELLALKKLADEKNITSYLVIDAGRTQIPTSSVTVLALGPDEDEIIDEVTGDLKLL